MGLVSKLKNILFEVEEVEIPVIEKKEKNVVPVQEYKEVPIKEEVKQSVPTQDYSNFYQNVESQVKQGGSKLDLKNLQSLCWSCHSRKSVEEGSRFGK